jgi:hypothetical protein
VLKFYESHFFFFYSAHIQGQKRYEKKPARTIRTKRISRMIKNKASENAFHLLLSNILFHREECLEERNRTKKEKKIIEPR